MNWYGHWVTTEEFARIMGRPHRTVQEWAANGTMVEFGIPVYRVTTGRCNTRHFIYAAPSLRGK